MNAKFIAQLGIIVCCQTQAAANNCSDQNYHAFDFWLGEWHVTTAKDDIIRHSKISLINDGCTILEEYSTPSGFIGKSLNIYDKLTGKWHQTWTDNSGQLLVLTGQKINNQMILTGNSQQNGETIIQRITWTANKNGTVRQLWQSKKLSEQQWQEVFDGLYRKQ